MTSQPAAPMLRLVSRSLRGLLVAGACVPVLTAAPQLETRADKLEGVDIEQLLEAELPLDASFQDEDAAFVTLGSAFDGLPVVMTLNYVDCPQQCDFQLSLLTESLSKVDLNLGEDYRIVTLSIEPDDTPAELTLRRDRYVAEYLAISEENGEERNAGAAEDGWLWLRGSRQEIDRVADAVGYGYKWLPAAGEYAHRATTIFASPGGVVTRYLPGLRTEMEDTMRVALIEAGKGKIGSLFENAFLLCFIQYDPDTGRYTPAARRLLSVAAALTVIAVASGIFFMKRNEEQRGPLEGAVAASANEEEQRP